MTNQKYSGEEALQRILETLKGNTPGSDVPGELTVPERYSKERSFSEIAELLANSLPNEQLTLLGEYGQIYVSGGSDGVNPPSGTWSKFTGFDTNGESSSLLSPDHANDQILIDAAGTYLVGFQASFSGEPFGLYRWGVYWNGARQEQVRARHLFDVSGSVNSISAEGFVNVTGTGANIDLRYSPDTTGTFAGVDVQLYARKVK